MISTPATVAVPLRTDECGAIRVGQAGVMLVTLVSYYKQGQNPEALHEAFPTVPMSDIYAVIAYYLANLEVIDEYLEEQERQAEEIRRQGESMPGYRRITREMLLQRLETRKRKSE